jgi:hypothetical protein
MKIHFEDAEGMAPSSASFEIPNPDTEGYAELLTDHFTTLADDAGIPFQKTQIKKGDAWVVNFMTTSQELFMKWRKNFPDGETEGFFAKHRV